MQETHTKQCFSILFFKFDKFQYRFGMSRQLWKADFQIQVWQKIQTLNPENPGIALEPASESLFSIQLGAFEEEGFL